MMRLGVVFDIVFDLFALCISETDDPSDLASVDKRNIVECVAFRNEPDHSDLVVLVPATRLEISCIGHHQLVCGGKGKQAKDSKNGS